MIIQSGFEFFGNGNIGDDLMLAGFLDAVKKLGIKATIHGRSRFNVGSQKRRFPEILWTTDIPRSPFNWVGIGDTPFQFTWGDNLLVELRGKYREMGLAEKRALVCVGAESEISPLAQEYVDFASKFGRISTRDSHSYRILTGMLGFPEELILEAADLANISLSRIGCASTVEKYDLGVVLASETFSSKDLERIGGFLSSYRGVSAFIAGDVRVIPYHEVQVHAEMIAAGLLPRDIALVIPPYDAGSLDDLVKGFAECSKIISSRYHCLLIGAWLGKKVSAIGRSSKVSALARDLEIPLCEPPLGMWDMEYLEKNAVQVSRERLLSLVPKALKGVEFSLGG